MAEKKSILLLKRSARRFLILLNPLNVMKKGYSITYQNNNVISSVKDLNTNDLLTIKMIDGEIQTQIIDIKEDQNGK